MSKIEIAGEHVASPIIGCGRALAKVLSECFVPGTTDASQAQFAAFSDLMVRRALSWSDFAEGDAEQIAKGVLTHLSADFGVTYYIANRHAEAVRETYSRLYSGIRNIDFIRISSIFLEATEKRGGVLVKKAEAYAQVRYALIQSQMGIPVFSKTLLRDYRLRWGCDDRTIEAHRRHGENVMQLWRNLRQTFDEDYSRGVYREL